MCGLKLKPLSHPGQGSPSLLGRNACTGCRGLSGSPHSRDAEPGEVQGGSVTCQRPCNYWSVVRHSPLFFHLTTVPSFSLLPSLKARQPGDPQHEGKKASSPGWGTAILSWPAGRRGGRNRVLGEERKQSLRSLRGLPTSSRTRRMGPFKGAP